MATSGSIGEPIAHPAWVVTAPPAPDRPKPLGLWICTAFVLVVACATLAFAVFRPVQVLPLLQPAPPLSLRDADGMPVTAGWTSGAIVVVQISALRCAAPCEDGHEALQEVQRRLADAPPRYLVRLVTVVLDGLGRSPALRARRAAVGADPRWWRLATAEAVHLKDAVGGGFGVYYAPDGAGRIAFDPATILVDERGIVRAVYRTPTPRAALIWRDIGLVAREASSGGPARALYSAAHLFLCYPR